LKESIKVDFRITPSTANLEEEEIVGAPENAGNASMPEQAKRQSMEEEEEDEDDDGEVGPCGNGMVRSQVADEGTDSNMEYRNEYIEKKNSRRQPKSGGPPARGLGEMLTATHCQNVSLYKMFKQKASYLD
jgi:hypothetical protein